MTRSLRPLLLALLLAAPTQLSPTDAQAADTAPLPASAPAPKVTLLKAARV
ncbi:MAG: hypothetical protein JST92_07640, partial [Deltaproteobacteria bacterium]|nr:hypothetical protein [Deltaproteobacteria bacterium]